jgi:hypothetical protein
MPKKLLVIAIVIGALILLNINNPTTDDFLGYVERQVQAAKDTRQDDLRNFMFGLVDETQFEAATHGAQRRDHTFYSVFVVDNVKGGKVHKVLGFAKKFFIPLGESPRPKQIDIY